MLYFNWRAKDGNKTHIDPWHIGGPIVDRRNEFLLDYIQADGNELEVITSVYKGIPTTDARVCIWRAPWAEFILDNMIIRRNPCTN